MFEKSITVYDVKVRKSRVYFAVENIGNETSLCETHCTEGTSSQLCLGTIPGHFWRIIFSRIFYR